MTVTDGGWDTHQNNFKGLKSRMPSIDQAIPQLIMDLEQRGLLETTLVCWFTDFGRTPKINSASGRDHWASTGFALMAGAGVPAGTILGATDNEGGYVSNPSEEKNLKSPKYRRNPGNICQNFRNLSDVAFALVCADEGS